VSNASSQYGFSFVATRGYAAILGDEMKNIKIATCTALLALSSVALMSTAKAATDDDKKFLAMAAQSDQNEIALSKVADEKASNPAVKAFADKMITEHTKMTETMKPFVESWGLTAPTGPDSDHQDEISKLNG
jgi:putative membrane protein